MIAPAEDCVVGAFNIYEERECLGPVVARRIVFQDFSLGGQNLATGGLIGDDDDESGDNEGSDLSCFERDGTLSRSAQFTCEA